MAWDHILQIIKNKCCWAASSKDGVYGKPFTSTSDRHNVLSYECMNRCTADRKNLAGGGVRQSHEHTQLLMDTFSVKTLWDNQRTVHCPTDSGRLRRTPHPKFPESGGLRKFFLLKLIFCDF